MFLGAKTPLQVTTDRHSCTKSLQIYLFATITCQYINTICTKFNAYGKKIGEWLKNITYGIKLHGWPKFATYGLKL